MRIYSLEETVKIFRALSDKNRIRILKILEKKPLCVCEITSLLGLAASTTSKHLRVLKNANLIFEQKEGKWVNYHLNRATQNIRIRELLPLLESWLNQDKTVSLDLEKIKEVDRKKLCKNI